MIWRASSGMTSQQCCGRWPSSMISNSRSCGLARLISPGELPQHESYHARMIAPVLDGVDAEATTVVFYVDCVGCKNFYALKVERAAYDRLLNRTECIQEIFPYLAPPMRELLISGTCPKCWKRMFGAEETSAESRGDDLVDIDGECVGERE